MGNALEVKTMNRQQRRAHKKMVEWLKSLSKDKQKIIDNYATERAKEMLHRSEELGMDMLLTNIDTSISATLINLFDIDRKGIETFLKVFNEILDENVDFTKNEGKDWKMKLEKIEGNVIEKAAEVIKEDKDKHNYKVKMKELFPKLTVGQLFNAYKLAEERLEDTKNDVDEALDYIFAEKQKEVVKEVTENVDKEIKEMANVKIKGKTIPKELKIENEKEEIKAPKLKIVERKLKVEGEYSSYLVDGNTVINGEKEFNSIQDVDKYEQEKILELAKQITELKAVFQMI